MPESGCRRRTLRARVVGATYHSRFQDASAWQDIPRGTQVLRYVERHSLVRWLAIDDGDDGFGSVARDHLILCDEERGLGDADWAATIILAGR
ncbi:HAD domain-containing protein [Paraburkholderia youngii]|uniref:HAD domain-containing protein n=1 Tax=Paraburkholderia youngii TaxID=2782701 RepID=UPI003D1FCC40